MAVWGFHATYEGVDLTNRFLAEKSACIRWSQEDAPGLHVMLSNIVAGDLVFLKSYTADLGIAIKAAGIVTSTAKRVSDLGAGVAVNWVWSDGPEICIRTSDGMGFMRRSTLYQEFSPKITDRVVELILDARPSTNPEAFFKDEVPISEAEIEERKCYGSQPVEPPPGGEEMDWADVPMVLEWLEVPGRLYAQIEASAEERQMPMETYILGLIEHGEQNKSR